jgi:hypothetical protein
MEQLKGICRVYQWIDVRNDFHISLHAGQTGSYTQTLTGSLEILQRERMKKEGVSETRLDVNKKTE